jgi:outer membrane protein assembly factor BamB
VGLLALTAVVVGGAAATGPADAASPSGTVSSTGPGTGPSLTAAVADPNDDWSMFGHDPDHSGVSPDTAIGAKEAPHLHELWDGVVGGQPVDGTVNASPAVVYSSTLKEVLAYETSSKGQVTAFDATTGHIVWSTFIGFHSQSTPAVYDNTLYIGDNDGTLHELNASTGQIDCVYTLPIDAPAETVPGRIQSSPVVGDVDGSGPVVFFGDEGQTENVNAGHEWALTGVGNSAGACKVDWVFRGWNDVGPKDNRTGSWAEPGLVKDAQGEWLLVFGSTNPDDSIYALDAATGAEVWRFQTQINGADQDVGAGPTISAPGVNGFADGVVYDVGKDGIQYALNLQTGAVIWTYTLPRVSGIQANPESVGDLLGDTLYQTYADYAFALNASTGALLWRTTTPMGLILGSPAISGASRDHVLFIGDLSGGVWGFSTSTGHLVWSTNVGASVVASPAVSDGKLFVADGTELGAWSIPPSTVGAGRATGPR